MRRIKIICPDGNSMSTQIIDLETGENLCKKYIIKSVSINLSVGEPVSANIEFEFPEIEIVAEEIETNHQILKGAL